MITVEPDIEGALCLSCHASENVKKIAISDPASPGATVIRLCVPCIAGSLVGAISVVVLDDIRAKGEPIGDGSSNSLAAIAMIDEIAKEVQA